MLRTRVQRATNANTATATTVTHALGAVPDLWHIEAINDRAQGRTYVVPGTVLTNIINIINGLVSNATVDVFCINYQGRLY